MESLGTTVWRSSIVELSGMLKRRELSPLELLETTLARIERINPRLNAIIALDPNARSEAKESEHRLARKEPRGPLEGIPLSVKDNILVRGMPATWGSKLFQDFVPERDELPVSRLREAGAVIIGKTNVPEFTLEGFTDNPLFGPTRNPWNIELTPGGSSGGGVASVAAGLTAASIGTDGGGSIRRPASHAGLVGLKPSTGLVARDYGFPQILLDFEVVGPIARTVADTALLLEVMAGPARRDRRSLLMATPMSISKPLRVLYVARFGDNPLDPEIADSCVAAARALESLGCRLEEGPLPFDVETLNATWPLFGQVGVAHLLDGKPESETLVGERLLNMAADGRKIPAHKYLAAIEQMDQFRRHMRDVFERWDVIMTPSAAALPWPAAQSHPAEIDGKPVGPRGHAIYTGWVNACGHPGLNLPCSPSSEGLPVGFQLVGDFGADRLLLELAGQYETARPWSDRWPAIAVE